MIDGGHASASETRVRLRPAGAQRDLAGTATAATASAAHPDKGDHDRDHDPAQRPSVPDILIPPVDDRAPATAAEQMFFHGAPLAHVVAYCEHRRMENISRNMARPRRGAGQRLDAGISILKPRDNAGCD